MKKSILIIVAGLLLSFVCFWLGRLGRSESFIFQLASTPIPTPLAKYSIENLKRATVAPAEFARTEEFKITKTFSKYAFTFSFDPTLSEKTKRKVSGVINLPAGEGPFPLIVMIRGYVDSKIYTPEMGAKNAAEFFADNGFITVTPDFLGYGGGDPEAGNIFESRFQTYTTLMTLLDSIATPNFAETVSRKWDSVNIFIWAHSNGGQIALTTLAITGAKYPTVLWAPVTKPFPYSVLFYTDESVDGGKLIRRELSKFESLYDVDGFSFTSFLAEIKAPLWFDQGTVDDAVPYGWTKSISAVLKKQGLDVTYNQYPGSDHNLRPAWNDVIEKDLNFFRKQLK